jgi:hypothetical protein
VFRGGDPSLSAKAFSLFEHPNHDLATALIETGELPKIASRLLCTEPDLLQLNRLASVSATALSVNLSWISSGCPFVMELIPYMVETSVLHLFEYLCRGGDGLRAAQEWMRENGFIAALIREIDKLDMKILPDCWGGVSDRLWALLHMLRYCTGSPVFVSLICSPQVVSVLNRSIGEQPSFIEDARWMALGIIYCGRTSEAMRGLFPSALEIISDAKTCRTEAAYAALRILQKMLAQDKVLGPFMVECCVTRIAMNLLVLNPDHTILHNGGRLLVAEFFECPITRARAIEDCLPTLIAARATDNRSLRASMFAIVRMLLKSKTGVGDMMRVPGFVELLKAVRQEGEMMNALYGGVPPSS